MILLFPQWQFGNQAFQYQFAKHFAKDDETILTTNEQYFSIIDETKEPRFKFLFWGKSWKYSNFLCFKIWRILAKLRIISHLKPEYIYYNQYRIEIIIPKYFNWFKKKIWFPNSIKNDIFIRK